jgi:hypothetical protein
MFMLLMLITSVIEVIATPLPALAQGAAPAPASLPPNATPPLVSLILLVIGLVAVGMVAVKVTGFPTPGARAKAAAVPEDDELIEDE